MQSTAALVQPNLVRPIDPASDQPDVVVQPLETRSGMAWVAREDLLLGGTKQRAIVPYLRSFISKGREEFVYASPFCGFAQVALAAAARELGVKATLFCELDPGARGEFHEYSRLAESLGAAIVPVKDLAEAESGATAHALRRSSRKKLPLGFRDVEFQDAMTEALRGQLARIQKTTGVLSRIWAPVGSGTLATSLIRATPATCRLLCVDVGVLSPSDERIASLLANPRVQLFREPRAFAERAAEFPLFPSNAHYDAKLWRWVRELGREGDLWWNVAR